MTYTKENILFIAKEEDAHAVFHTKGGSKSKVGPNPLNIRGCEIVMRVLERLNLDYEETEEAWNRNAAAVTCPKLRRWVMNYS